MALKTFNIDEKVYKKFSNICKENGISMSKQVEFFMKAQTAEEKKVRKKFLDRLKKIRKGKFIKISDFSKEFRLE